MVSGLTHCVIFFCQIERRPILALKPFYAATMQKYNILDREALCKDLSFKI